MLNHHLTSPVMTSVSDTYQVRLFRIKNQMVRKFILGSEKKHGQKNLFYASLRQTRAPLAWAFRPAKCRIVTKRRAVQTTKNTLHKPLRVYVDLDLIFCGRPNL